MSLLYHNNVLMSIDFIRFIALAQWGGKIGPKIEKSFAYMYAKDWQIDLGARARQLEDAKRHPAPNRG